MNRLLGGRYEILEKIGEGGMAIVYKAKCRLLNRYVAIKILKPEYIEDKKFLENFRNESLAAASMSNPNIVNIYDMGVEGKNINYIVMEYVEGEPLSRILDRKKIIPGEQAVSIAKQIAAGLSCAHKNNIVHRDVKPHNIMVSPDGTAKITDFGIARAVSNTTLVASDAIIGSVHYASPEQAKGGYINGKSDIYSLGIVLYEMATGRVPFDGDNPVSIAMMHINNEITPPSEYNPDISEELEAVIMTAVQKYQVDRFPDCETLIEALDQLTPEMLAYSTDAEALGLGKPEEGPDEGITVNDGSVSVTSNTLVMGMNRNAGEGYHEEDNGMQEEMNGNIPQNLSKKEMKAAKKAAKKQAKLEKKQNKKKFFTFTRFMGIIVGILIAIGASLGILAVIDSFVLPEVKVPDVVGLDYVEAQKVLSNSGLSMNVEERVYSNVYDVDEVCSQDPKEGGTVKEGDTINVTISKGISSGELPSVVGMTLDQAKVSIRSSGYEIGTITRMESTDPEGTVIGQDPWPGSVVNPGDTIDLVVSSGGKQKTIEMVDLIGLEVSEAEDLLEEAGLEVRSITQESSSKYKEGVVISQSVLAGEKVKTGTAISLTVSTGQSSASSASDVTVSVEMDYSDVTADGFNVKIDYIQGDKVNVLHNKTHYKRNDGEKIKIKGSGKGVLKIYYDDILVSEGNINFDEGTYTD